MPSHKQVAIWREGGLCSYCGGVPAPGRKLCRPCCQHANATQQADRQIERVRALLADPSWRRTGTILSRRDHLRRVLDEGLWTLPPAPRRATRGARAVPCRAVPRRRSRAPGTPNRPADSTPTVKHDPKVIRVGCMLSKVRL